MSIQTQINRITANIADAYRALEVLGATLPSEQNSDNLAATIASLASGVVYFVPQGSDGLTTSDGLIFTVRS